MPATDLLAEVTELALRLRPPLHVVGVQDTGSFDDATVELRDDHVTWWIVRERSVLDLVAAPAFETLPRYDVDLLKRFLGYKVDVRRTTPGSSESFAELMRRSVEDLMKELEQLRKPVAAAFNESTWEKTRGQLLDLARRSDAELFGRPYPPK